MYISKLIWNVILFFALVLSMVSQADAKFEGTWLICHPDMSGRRYPYTALQVIKKESKYDVFSETGDRSVFVGKGDLIQGDLVVRGCTYYIDHPTNGCDPNQPPVAFTLESQKYQRNASVTKMHLLKFTPIYVTNKDLDSLKEQCERLVNLPTD